MLLNKLKDLYTHLRGDRRRPATPVAVRPTLDTLEDRTVPTTVVSDFAGQGLYTYLPGANYWQQINGHDPSAMAVNPYSGDVVATFPGYGTALWKAGGKSWQVLTGADASVLSMPWAGHQVVAEFPGYGVWEFHPNTGWAQLTPAESSSLATDVLGNVVAEFPGHGVWMLPTSTNTWTQMTPADASQVVFADAGFVIAEFPGYGVWSDHGGVGWVQMTGADASALAGTGNGGMAAASFNGYGTYAYNVSSNAWYLLNTSPNYALATDGADFAGVFAGDLGLVTSYYGAGTGTWQDFDSSGASLIGISAL